MWSDSDSERCSESYSQLFSPIRSELEILLISPRENCLGAPVYRVIHPLGVVRGIAQFIDVVVIVILSLVSEMLTVDRSILNRGPDQSHQKVEGKETNCERKVFESNRDAVDAQI